MAQKLTRSLLRRLINEALLNPEGDWSLDDVYAFVTNVVKPEWLSQYDGVSDRDAWHQEVETALEDLESLISIQIDNVEKRLRGGAYSNT